MPKFPVVVPGSGPIPSHLMIVGEAPGRDEIASGRPFVGAAGRRLEEELATCGRSRDEFFWTNAFQGDVGDGNRDPIEDELADHAPILLSEIQQVRPRAIMTVGRFATRALLPNLLPSRNQPPFGPLVGGVFLSSVADVPVFPRHHTAARRTREMREADLLAVRRFCHSIDDIA